jgi:hypothetical protein
MRLLNVNSLQIEEFSGSTIPAYAILSHCWGESEVSFEDINLPGNVWMGKLGAKKIKYACEQSKRDGWDWVWIDTCCIDKRSSAELSEAINSMYNWYEASQVCYAYLEDVFIPSESFKVPDALITFQDLLKRSRWFTRGWTLQELIAPAQVVFYGKYWNSLGTRKALAERISDITRIPKKILQEPLELEYASVAKRMSWAAGRQTTRVEDVAYCLLGLFDVNMPLLYGEGTKAFIRLQEEILKNSDDQSIFAWDTQQDAPWDEASLLDSGILAGSPAAFADSGNIIPFPVKAKRQPFSMTNRGLRIELRLSLERDELSQVYYLALLNCQYENDFTGCVGIVLKETSEPSLFSRHSGFGSGMRKVDINEMGEGKMSTIYIRKIPRLTERLRRYETCLLQPSKSIAKQGYKIVETRPKNTVWNADSQTLQIWINHYQSSWAAFHFYSKEKDLGFVVFFKISDAKDRSFVKICDLAAGGMTHHWLVTEAKTGFENSEGSCRLVTTPSWKQEGKSDGGRSQLITARARSAERLNQEVCKITWIQFPILARFGSLEMFLEPCSDNVSWPLGHL